MTRAPSGMSRQGGRPSPAAAAREDTRPPYGRFMETSLPWIPLSSLSQMGMQAGRDAPMARPFADASWKRPYRGQAIDEPQRGSMSVAPDFPQGYRGETAKMFLNPGGVPCSFLSHRLRQPLRGSASHSPKQGRFQRWGEASPPSRKREASKSHLLSIAVDSLGGAASSRANVLCDLAGVRT